MNSEKLLEEIDQYLRENLSEKRYIHSVGVMKRCEILAKINNVDVETCKLVGIAHDIAKEMNKEKYIQFCEKNNIKVDEIEKIQPGLLHAKVGAFICKEKYNFTDEMCNAIRCHTTGGSNLDVVSKILICADKTEENRGFSDLDFISKLSEENLDEAVKYIMDVAIKENLKKGKLVHLNSVITRNEIVLKFVEK